MLKWRGVCAPGERILMNCFFTHAALLVSLSGTALFASAQATPHASDNDTQAAEEVRRLNAEEVDAFLHQDPKVMERLWSDDFVVTNPLNKFVTKQQVLGMVKSGFLIITSFDRQIEYVRVYDDAVIVAGSETVVWGGKTPAKPNIFASPEYG